MADDNTRPRRRGIAMLPEFLMLAGIVGSIAAIASFVGWMADKRPDLSIVLVTDGKPDEASALVRLQALDIGRVGSPDTSVAYASGRTVGRIVLPVDAYTSSASNDLKTGRLAEIREKAAQLGESSSYLVVVVQPYGEQVPNDYMIRMSSGATETPIKFAER